MPLCRDAFAATRASSSCGTHSSQRAAHQRRDIERQKAVMTQPSQIRIIKGAQIGDAVFEHRHPLDPHAKCKALKLRRVDAAILQYLGMNHAAAENLEPIAAGADFEPPALAR